MAVLGGVVLFAICVLGTLFDILTAVYIDALSDKCDGEVLVEDRCYCGATEDLFGNIFQDVGDIDCYNPYTRNTSFLIANAVLSGLCALVALYLCVTALGNCVMDLCGCGSARYEQVQPAKRNYC